jgi:hypothetical protein
MAGRFRLKATMSALSIGDLENVAITRIDSSEDSSFGKFRINGIVTKREMNSFIREYKEEMKRKGVIIPGFRPGNVPPHAMQEIREFVVSHALETLLGEMCNVNGLMVSVYTCSKSEGAVLLWLVAQLIFPPTYLL